jgi:peptidoglycan/LPS O-acetylase OafA/YrhL
MMLTQGFQMKIKGHIPELDGVRGIAVLLVVVYHAFVFSTSPLEGRIATLASYGFAGVDLFFVLSGFLITGILLSAKGKPAYFRNFYAKRALRIWPLYYLLLLFAFGLLPFLIHHAHLAMGESALLEGKSKIVYIFLLQNLWYPGSAGPTILGMTWSLAIEEQFYIVWPWLVLLCGRKTLVCILAAILVLSPGIRLWASLHGVSREAIYYMTWFRLDGLALGALIAVWCKSSFYSLRITKSMTLAALAAGVPASLWLLSGHSKTLWPLLFSMLALASTGLVVFAIWSCGANSIQGRPLRSSWLRYIGKISYCLYLVHQPIYYALGGRLGRRHFGTTATISLMILGFVISLSIASLSWYLFESQILKLKDKLEYRQKMDAPALG